MAWRPLERILVVLRLVRAPIRTISVPLKKSKKSPSRFKSEIATVQKPKRHSSPCLTKLFDSPFVTYVTKFIYLKNEHNLLLISILKNIMGYVLISIEFTYQIHFNFLGRYYLWSVIETTRKFYSRRIRQSSSAKISRYSFSFEWKFVDFWKLIWVKLKFF